MNNPFSLSGKKILITGASSGIGKATAIECSKLGANYLLLTGRKLEALRETASCLTGNCEIKLIQCDLQFESQIVDLVSESDKLDGVVLNAGISELKLLQFATLNDFEEIFNINCFSPIILLRHLLKKKKINESASLVFTSSISGNTNVSIGNGLYGASKAALTSLMKYLAVELSNKKIRCNSVHPGRVETPLIQKNFLDQDSLNKDIQKYPLKRYGKPEEVAYAIIYLLSDATSWITGTSLVIDGGRSLV